MSEKTETNSHDEPDLERRKVIWRALGAAPVILTLSSRPAWASHQYGHYSQGGGDPPPGCDPPVGEQDENCNPND